MIFSPNPAVLLGEHIRFDQYRGLTRAQIWTPHFPPLLWHLGTLRGNPSSLGEITWSRFFVSVPSYSLWQFLSFQRGNLVASTDLRPVRLGQASNETFENDAMSSAVAYAVGERNASLANWICGALALAILIVRQNKYTSIFSSHRLIVVV